MKNWNRSQRVVFQCLIVGLIVCAFASQSHASEAVEAVAAKSEKTQTVTSDQINGWIKSLDSNDPEVRQQAAKQLQQSGTAAVDALTKAADTRNPELSTQCVEILKNLYESKDASAKKAATTGLKELEQSKIKQVAQRAKVITKKVAPAGNNRFAGLRKMQIQAIQKALQQAVQNKELKNVVKDGNKTIEIREIPNKQIIVKITEKIDGKDKVTEVKAKSLIELRGKNKEAYELYKKHKPKRPKAPNIQFGGNMGGGGIRIIAGMAGGGNGFRKSQTITNGQRHTEVEQNGRKIVIDDFKNTEIKMSITETVKGKKKTTEYKAKDLEELKKKHPAAAKEYEKHNSGGGIQIRIQGAGFPPNFPALPIQIQKIQIKQQNKLEEMKKKMKQQIEEQQKQIKKELEKGIET